MQVNSTLQRFLVLCVMGSKTLKMGSKILDQMKMASPEAT